MRGRPAHLISVRLVRVGHSALTRQVAGEGDRRLQCQRQHFAQVRRHELWNRRNRLLKDQRRVRAGPRGGAAFSAPIPPISGVHNQACSSCPNDPLQHCAPSPRRSGPATASQRPVAAAARKTPPGCRLCRRERSVRTLPPHTLWHRLVSVRPHDARRSTERDGGRTLSNVVDCRRECAEAGLHHGRQIW